MDLKTLSVDDVLYIHNVLVADFSASKDPIVPPGVKSRALLESAVGRQWTSHGDVMKYPDAVENAATLMYGLCCDHPFHNGNKRTALVAMLVHLDKNKLSLFDTRQDELFELVLRVAQHHVAQRPDSRRKRPLKRVSADREVEAIAQWLHKRVNRVVRGERQIRFRELRRILSRFGYQLKDPHGNYIDIVRPEIAQTGLFKKREISVTKHIGRVGYHGEGTMVSLKDLKLVRRLCWLTEEHGVDSDAFYDDTAVVDAFVNRYRTILRRLAHR